jgi:RNA 3'-terminal phosphate cyclase
LSAAGNLPEHVSQRQSKWVNSRLGEEIPVREIGASGPGRGSLVFIWGPRAGFSALGAKGKPAETVAEEAVQAYTSFRGRQAGVDKHLADQVLIYLALAQGESVFTTEEITPHLLTNIQVIERFLGPTFQVEGALGARGRVVCAGKGQPPDGAKDT